MGLGFSLPKFKTKVRVAIQRLKLQVNKKTNVIHNVTRREVITLLKEGKDESARIHTELMMREQNLITAMEVVQMMSELLLTRALYLESSKDRCPADMEEACATVIFAATRMDIPELEDIAKMLASKYSQKWAESHRDNESGVVNRKIVILTDVRPPPYQSVLQRMREVARLYKFNWKPKDKGEDYQALGGVVKKTDEEEKAHVLHENDQMKGTLNVTVHEAKDLYEKSWLGGKRPFVKCYVSGNKSQAQKTQVATGPSPEWKDCHMPFHVPGAQRVLCVEVHNQSSARDELMLKSKPIQIDFIEPGQARWFALLADKKHAASTSGSNSKNKLDPQISLSFQFMHLNDSPTVDGVVDQPLPEAQPILPEDLKLPPEEKLSVPGAESSASGSSSVPSASGSSSVPLGQNPADRANEASDDQKSVPPVGMPATEAAAATAAAATATATATATAATARVGGPSGGEQKQGDPTAPPPYEDQHPPVVGQVVQPAFDPNDIPSPPLNKEVKTTKPAATTAPGGPPMETGGGDDDAAAASEGDEIDDLEARLRNL
eukprot:CAMPEP_0197516722 /NCGR_PEP_ID=MMETSP1318-20131121/1633_1 /TAXON_ID=552666 /ORGANISM="Partenskyella glossopodia, Strain RCC365" /LENGTH=548 /DNA_ID=CAMNT_0043065681 /DNA_START=120 /DNA_END=1766 /DNA_ORIENTATION=-